MVAGCEWTDRLIELQLWARLTFLAYETRDHSTVARCAAQALAFSETGTQPKKAYGVKKSDKDK